LARSIAARRRSAFLILILTVMVLSLSGQARDDEQLHSGFDIATEVALLVRLQYVDPVRVTDLLSAYMATDTIEGMLESLGDQYTRYMDPEAYRAYAEDVEGTYSGIGIHVGLLNGRATVVAPMPDTPAKRAGLASGDVIMAIDGKSTENMSLEEAVSLMKGPEGTRVVLTIKREGEEELRDVEIVRAVIVVPVVESEILGDGIGYLRIVTFSADTADQAHRALEDLRSHGADGLVLDLRWNGGGLFDQSVLVASMFVEEGPIVHRVGRGGARNTHMKNPEVPTYDMPLVVLVNQWSASSAEILAGALKDSGRAPLVGTQTFGKGVVQGVFPLGNGGALSVTTDRYLTAAEHSIHGQGIAPDYIVELPEPGESTASEQLEPSDPGEWEVVDLSEPTESGSTSAGAAEDSNETDEDPETQVEVLEDVTVVDTQLLRALEVLRSMLAGDELREAS
jgi:carboxyl-terminal processing protease